MKGYTGRRSGWKWGLLILAVALILAGVLGFRCWNGQSRTVAMSDQERETYGLYRVTPPDGESAALTSEGLLTHCTPETTEVLDNNGEPLETVTLYLRCAGGLAAGLPGAAGDLRPGRAPVYRL